QAPEGIGGARPSGVLTRAAGVPASDARRRSTPAASSASSGRSRQSPGDVGSSARPEKTVEAVVTSAQADPGVADGWVNEPPTGAACRGAAAAETGAPPGASPSSIAATPSVHSSAALIARIVVLLTLGYGRPCGWRHRSRPDGCGTPAGPCGAAPCPGRVVRPPDGRSGCRGTFEARIRAVPQRCPGCRQGRAG